MPTPCPRREEYERLLGGDLGETEELRLETHVRACTDCLKMLAGLTAVSPQLLPDSGVVPHRAADSPPDPLKTGVIDRSKARSWPAATGARPALPQVPGYSCSASSAVAGWRRSTRPGTSG